MAYINFINAQKSKGTYYAATLACLCGVPITVALEWLRKSSHKTAK
jgi:hypothetical protein